MSKKANFEKAAEKVYGRNPNNGRLTLPIRTKLAEAMGINDKQLDEEIKRILGKTL